MATKECLHTGLDVFSPQALHTAIEDSEYVEHRSLAALDSQGTIDFVVSPSSTYLDLSQSYLRVKAKITLANGDNIAGGARVALVNYGLHSMFSDVTVYVGGVQISSCSGAYPYQAYLQSLLSFGVESKHSHLQGAMWYSDTAGHMDAVAGENNKGAKARKSRAAESKVMDMVGRLHSDVFHQGKFLLNHVEVRIKLTRSKDEFVIISDTTPVVNRPDFKLELLDAGLFVRKVHVNPAIALAHEKTLLQHNAKYPLTKLVMRLYTAPANSYNFSADNMFLDHLPNRMVVGLVKATAYNGDYAQNPFNFEHCNITNLSLYHHGKQIPTKGLQPDFANHQYTRSFMSLFTGTNTAWSDHSCGIEWHDYPRGYTVWVFDLTNSLSHTPDAAEVRRAGPLRLEIKFAEALAEAYNLIVYAEFDSRLEITRSREVIVL